MTFRWMPSRVSRRMSGTWLQDHCPHTLANIEDTGTLSDQDRQDLSAGLDRFLNQFQNGVAEPR